MSLMTQRSGVKRNYNFFFLRVFLFFLLFTTIPSVYENIVAQLSTKTLERWKCGNKINVYGEEFRFSLLPACLTDTK